MRLRVAMLCALAAAGCGGSDDASPDAAVGVDAGPDAAVDAAMLDAAVGSLAVTPASHDYGTVVLGCPLSSVFQITNTGNAAVGPLTTSVVGSAAFQITADACTGQSLPPGETCDVTVYSTPSSVGSQSASLTVGVGPVQAVAPLTAVAVAAGFSNLAPYLQNYGSVRVGQTSVPVTFTVTNLGGAAVGPLATTITGGDAADFVQETDLCSGMLNPGASCTVTVRFAPTTVGAKTATLKVMGSAGCGTATTTTTATLNGTGFTTDLAVTPGAHDFGQIIINRTSSDVVFTATNTSAATGAPLTVALGGNDAAHFAISGGTCVSGTTTLSAGGSCTVLVRFSPTSNGQKSAFLLVTDVGGRASAGLTGTGIYPFFVISPAAQDFGTVVVGTSSAGATFTVTSAGMSIGPLSVSRSGTGAGDFAVTADGCSGVTLADSSCTITLAFNPSTSGAKTASLDVTTPIATVHTSASLSGTGFTP